jgi:hypothetical protein
VRFQLVSYGSPLGFRLVMTGKQVPDFNANIGKARVALSPDTKQREQVMAVYGKVDDLHAATVSLAFVPEDAADATEAELAEDKPVGPWVSIAKFAPFESSVRNVRVEFESGETLDFRVGDMTKALETMRTCVATLYKFWKLDPNVQKSVARGPVQVRSPIGRMNRRYPEGMLGAGIGAYVPVRIMVDAAGKATDCVVQQEGVKTAFREHVCEGLTVRYDPALDADGKPVPSVFNTSVIYTVGR